MHLTPTNIPHIFEAGNRRAEVHFVDGERYDKWRVVYQARAFESDPWRVISPEYISLETVAIDKAKGWTFHQ